MTKLRVALPLALAACAGSTFDGLWLFQFAGDVDIEGSSTCEENFSNARCPRDETVTDDDEWTVELDANLSDGLRFAEIVEGTGNTGWLLWDGLIIPIRREGATIVGSYTGSTDSTRTETHESGYRFNITQVAETEVEVTLELDEDGTYAGTITRTSTSSTSWEESDEWDPDEVGRFSSAMEAFTDGLESTEEEEDTGFGDDFTGNDPETDDCASNFCRGSRVAETAVELEVRALPTVGERDPGAGDYEQPVTPPGGVWVE